MGGHLMIYQIAQTKINHQYIVYNFIMINARDLRWIMPLKNHAIAVLVCTKSSRNGSPFFRLLHKHY